MLWLLTRYLNAAQIARSVCLCFVGADSERWLTCRIPTHDMERH